MGAWSEWDELLAEPAPDPMAVLKLTAQYQRYLDAIQIRAVPAARAAGHTWEEIGQALGTSRQAVWQRYRGVLRPSVSMEFRPPPHP